MTIAVILAGRSGGGQGAGGAGVTVHSAAGADKVGAAISMLTEKRIGAVPVVDDGAVVGIFSERDVIHCLTSHGAAALDLNVRDVMTSPVISITPDTGIMAALSLMTRRRIRHLPVMEGGALLGFVSIGDLVKHRIEVIESEAAAMRDYIAGS